MISKKYVVTAEWDGRYSLRVNGIHVVDSFATVFSARKSIERRITATLRNWKRYSYTAITRDGYTISAEPPPRPVQVLVRMPPVLHEQLRRMADTNEISLNRLIVEILRDR